jgi:hypothetical protein
MTQTSNCINTKPRSAIMIIAIPRHVAQSADLSARARIPAISQILVAAALALAQLEDRLSGGTRSIDLSDHLSARTRSVDLSDHLGKDIGMDRLRQNPERPVVFNPYPHL